MAMHPSDVQEGKCYVTSKGQVRRVIKLEGDRVVYEARDADPKRQWRRPTRIAKRDKFAAAAEREVPCDVDARQPKFAS
jgi:hypothetical protein